MAFNIVEKIDDNVKINNVLASVSDKTDLEIIVNTLAELNPDVHFYSTGNTYQKISEILGGSAGSMLTPVSGYTGQPEMQGGLVKTLDFKIYLGLLSETYNDAHRQDIKRVGGIEFDMVIANLYPFKQTVSRSGISFEQARGNIDIGGPCMVRASAKNFIRVVSVCNPSDYQMIADELKNNNCCISLATRLEMAKKAFSHTADYDDAIRNYFNNTDYGRIKDTYNF